jgi:hypothetical protein
MANSLELVNTAAGAFVAGLITSVHCVGMCGPLACGVAGLGKSCGVKHGAVAGYHGGRLFSYTLLGAIAGAIGQVPVQAMVKSPAVLLPWVLILALVVIGFGLDKRLPRIPLLHRVSMRLRGWFTKLGPGKGGLALGLATPLLPCTPLYFILGAALVSGSPGRGAEFMAAFAMGTIPLLWVTQGGWFWLRGKFGAGGMDTARRALALVTALILAWRLRGTLPWIELSGPGCCGG